MASKSCLPDEILDDQEEMKSLFKNNSRDQQAKSLLVFEEKRPMPEVSGLLLNCSEIAKVVEIKKAPETTTPGEDPNSTAGKDKQDRSPENKQQLESIGISLSDKFIPQEHQYEPVCPVQIQLHPKNDDDHVNINNEMDNDDNESHVQEFGKFLVKQGEGNRLKE